MYWHKKLSKSFPGDSPVKNPPANAGDMGQIPNQDPTCHGATKPVRHNYWACALELGSHDSWGLHALEPVLYKRSHCKEKPVHCNERVPPCSPQLQKSLRSKEDPAQPKINKINKTSS